MLKEQVYLFIRLGYVISHVFVCSTGPERLVRTVQYPFTANPVAGVRSHKNVINIRVPGIRRGGCATSGDFGVAVKQGHRVSGTSCSPTRWGQSKLSGWARTVTMHKHAILSQEE